MKAIKFFLVIAALVASIQPKAQTIDPASEWRVNYWYGEPGFELHTDFYRDFIDGDTILNGTRYFKVYRSGYTRIDWNIGPGYYYFSHDLHGFLREENHKWYTYWMNDQTDKLLYDFTLGVNDTVFSAYTFWATPIIVTSVDSVLVDSHYKRRLHLNTPYGADNIIEDIGPASGLFQNMVFFEWESQLICFAKDDISLWGASTSDCELNVGVPEPNGKTPDVSAFPNPAVDYTNLSIPPGLLVTKVSLIDPLGRKIRSDFKITGQLVTIPLVECSPGLYMIMAETGSKPLMIKLMVN